MSRLILQTNILGEHWLWLLNQRGLVLRSQRFVHQHHGADQLLAEIVGFTEGQKLSGILVVRGPGPFTAIRAALVIANTLAWVKNIPVVGLVRQKKLDPAKIPQAVWGRATTYRQPVRPCYGRQPNITRPKKSLKR